MSITFFRNKTRNKFRFGRLIQKYLWGCKQYICLSIYIREYRKANQTWTIQRNCQHKVHNTKKRKTVAQHIMCWTPLCASKDNQRK
jgi:hypothetical protein